MPRCPGKFGNRDYTRAARRQLLTRESDDDKEDPRRGQRQAGSDIFVSIGRQLSPSSDSYCLLWDAARAKPGLKREGGCRRDGSSPQVDATRAPAIGSAGSEATGLAPPSMIAKGMGSVSARKHRDGFARVLRNKSPPPSIRAGLLSERCFGLWIS
jgi:hypothetical protein